MSSVQNSFIVMNRKGQRFLWFFPHGLSMTFSLFGAHPCVPEAQLSASWPSLLGEALSSCPPHEWLCMDSHLLFWQLDLTSLLFQHWKLPRETFSFISNLTWCYSVPCWGLLPQQAQLWFPLVGFPSRLTAGVLWPEEPGVAPHFGYQGRDVVLLTVRCYGIYSL